MTSTPKEYADIHDKLLYYVQAWHLAFYLKPLFKSSFQAWIHGPVNRTIFDRFKDTKSLYSDIFLSDVKTPIDQIELTEDAKGHINNVLETYAVFTSTQLEEMTHNEDPWINARANKRPTERCEDEISEDLM
eukprot:gene3721-5070_t